MDILGYLSRTRYNRFFSVAIIIMLTMVGAIPILGTLSAVDEASAEEEMAGEETFANVRSGYYNIAEYGYEYYLQGHKSQDYLGHSMVTMDWNGDGVEDLVVSGLTYSYNYNTNNARVYIFDGTTAVQPPNLRMISSEADWKLYSTETTQYMDFAADLAVGDVNGDGYDDLLVSEKGYVYTGNAYLYYGGPDWDTNRGEFDQTNADVKFTHSVTYTCFARSVGLGDLDGDGYDDIAISAPYYYVNSKYGIVYVWFGSSTFSGTKAHTSADFTYQCNQGYSSGYYNHMGTGPIQFGDMDGDGREELVVSAAYGYGASTSYTGGVYVLHPRDNIKSASGTVYTSSTTYGYSTCFYASSSSTYLGLMTRVGDINGDGLADLVTSSWYGGSTGRGATYVKLGSATYSTGIRTLTSSSEYDFMFDPQSGSSWWSALEMGDWDGDGVDDIAIGAPYGSSCKIWIFGGNFFNGGGGKFDLDDDIVSSTLITIGGPTITSSNYLCMGGYPYFYYPTMDTMVFWNRDLPDPAEDLFFSNIYEYVGGSYGYGAIYGISNYDMIGKPQVRALNAELPDYKTMYVGRQSYDFRASVMNRWDPSLGTLDIEIIMGSYEVELSLSADGNWSVDGDDLGWLDIDHDSFAVTIDNVNSEAIWTWTMGFTLNTTFDGYIDLIVDNGMSKTVIDDFAYLRSKFRFTGALEAWVGGDPQTRFYNGEDHRQLYEGETVPEDTDIIFSGIGIVYEGTEDFMDDFGVEPFYPKQEYFYFEAGNIHDQMVRDETSMGRDFILPLNTGSMPIKVTFDFMLRGLPGSMVVNELPGFHVYVDNDIPMAPSGILIHADSFTDPNVLVDNDPELFVTWYKPTEIFSGVLKYEVMATGVEDTMFTTNTFLRFETDADGEVEVSVRAYDMVGHVGEYASASIFLDYQGLGFTDPYPGPEDWFNTLNPEVGVTITDIGGLSIKGNSIEYTVDGDGVDDEEEPYGPWISANYPLNAHSINIEVTPTLKEGTENYVIFRAQDAAGNRMESDPVRVSIDLSEVQFGKPVVGDMIEWEGVWFDSGDVSFEIEIFDGLSGVDPATVEYRLSTRGRANLNSESWEEAGAEIHGGNASVDLDLELINGDVNFIQFRAKDLVGNPTAYSDIFNIWVNTEPVPAIGSPVDGLRVMEGSIISIDASSSYDIDGDIIDASWNDTWTNIDGEETVIELGSDARNPFKFDVILEPGTHMITLTISDGLHDVMVGPIAVFVTAIEDPIWLDPTLDTDGDGMPNAYEFMYHLGWEDGSNGGIEINDKNDFDGDGYTDLQEYQAQTNPTDINDFPLDIKVGKEAEDPDMTLYIILVVLAVLVFITLIVLIALNSMAIKKKLSEQEVKEAEVEKQEMERALSSGGREKLEALKAVSEGKRVASLPSAAAAVSAYQTLPTAEGAAEQGMEGGAPSPEPLQPTPMQAAEPAPAPAPTWAAAPPAAEGQGQQAYQGDGTEVQDNLYGEN